MADINSFFEKIFIVSLQRRRDRLDPFLDQFRTLGLDWNVEIFSAVDGSRTGAPDWWSPGKPQKEREGAYGCWRSHTAIWERAISEGWRNVLVFEDDCEFLPDFAKNLSEVIAVLPERWDFLYLGGEMVKMKEQKPFQFNEKLLYAYNVNRTHAYCLNRSIMRQVYAEVMRRDPECRWHIDWMMGQVQMRPEVVSLAAHPWLCAQRGGESDIFPRTKAKEIFEVQEVYPMKEFELFDISFEQVGYGSLSVGDRLGYEGLLINVPDTEGWQGISAHAPSRVVLNVKEPMDVFGAQNGDVSAKQSHIAVVDGEKIGSVQAAGSKMPVKHLEPGIHTLEFQKSSDNSRAHTLWMFRKSLDPVIEIYCNAVCPRHCAECNQKTLMKAEPQYSYGLDDAKALVESLKKHHKKIRVCFTGGEPAIWKERRVVMDFLRSSGVVTGNWVVTSQCEEATIQDLQSIFDKVCVSIRPEKKDYLTDRPEWLRDVTLWDQSQHAAVPEKPMDGPIDCCCASQGIVAAIKGQQVFPCVVAQNMKLEGRWDSLEPISLDDYFGGARKLAIGTYNECRRCVNNLTIRRNGILVDVNPVLKKSDRPSPETGLMKK